MTDIQKRISKEKLEAFHIAIAKSEYAIPVPPVNNYHIHGVYVRELPVPAGVVIGGLVHKHEQIFILSQGVAEIATENGVEHIEAGHISVAKPGIMRTALALTDCRFISVLHNPEGLTEEDKIMEYYTEKPSQALLEAIESRMIK